MPPKLRRYIYEIVIDCSFHERNAKGRKVFKYRTDKMFFPIRAKDLTRARKRARKIMEEQRRVIALLVDERLYEEVGNA